ncbi:hypothetical protein [Methanobrevibacter filiformis]|uniref:Uncharacterized protein n=1 Tax=Methanobrevibacter filiformis TaxID=55758 RepID=A0A166E566_9EURY|nr:hypothetical protein [Methanobrevibacter filiformis]KZX16292.1 hypothetical protein MBFIL_05280 [Methanobrevibacter filiformis]
MLLTSNEKKLFFPLFIAFMFTQVMAYFLADYNWWWYNLSLLIVLIQVFIFVLNPSLICGYYARDSTMEKILLTCISIIFIFSLFYFGHNINIFYIFVSASYLGFFLTATSNFPENHNTPTFKESVLDIIVCCVLFYYLVYFNDLHGSSEALLHSVQIILISIFWFYVSRFSDSEFENSRIFTEYKWGFGILSIIGFILVICIGFFIFTGWGVAYY